MVIKPIAKQVLSLLLIFCFCLCMWGCSSSGKDSQSDDDDFVVNLQSYENERGIGFFYPPERERLSGIAKVYGLAYIDEGWLEEDRGVGKVTVHLGDEVELEARTYVKNRYWIRTFDTADFPDGPLNITVTAYDLDGNLIGSVSNTVLIDNQASPILRRLYAASDGTPEGDGTAEHPWDTATALDNLQPGDLLYLKGGVYTENLSVSKSGTAEHPITIMGIPGEKVELTGAGIDLEYEVCHVNILGIDQSGLRGDDNGAELADSVSYIQFWDCSFNDNTHPYETMPKDKGVEWGTGFRSEIMNVGPGQNRRYITVSHCEAKYNDVDGFQFSSIDHGRFQYLESAWNPNHKTADIFQYKHANGFVSKNSEYEGWGTGSEDNVYLFCYSHHNGQDGWDIRSPHTYLYGCVTHDEAQAGNYFGGLGIKFWEYDYRAQSCLNFRNNLVDGTGQGMVARDYTKICNTAFYNVRNAAVSVEDKNIAQLISNNNIFMDYIQDFTQPVKSRGCIYFGEGTFPSTNSTCITADPMFIDPEKGNFFLQEGSPALTEGNNTQFTFDVDGFDYGQLDGLGRPRSSRNEVGPYTRLPDETSTED